MRYYYALCSKCSGSDYPVFRNFEEHNNYIECKNCGQITLIKTNNNGTYSLEVLDE